MSHRQRVMQILMNRERSDRRCQDQMLWEGRSQRLKIRWESLSGCFVIFLRIMDCIVFLFSCVLLSVYAMYRELCFTQSLIDDYIVPLTKTAHPNFGPLAAKILQVAGFYGIGVITTYAYNRIMVNVTQGTLRNLRVEMFEKMETLPIKYFDTNAHGDIMSTYTNDIDTLRQMISQSIPQAINCV